METDNNVRDENIIEDSGENAGNPKKSESSNFESHGRNKKNYLGIIAGIAILAAAAFLIYFFYFMPSKDSYSGYKFSELEKVKIESIERYNADNGTNILSLDSSGILSIEAALYKSGETVVMLGERLAFGDGGSADVIEFYAVGEKTNVDILDSFFGNSSNRMTINETQIIFAILKTSSEGFYSTKFAFLRDGYEYYVKVDSSSSGDWTRYADELTKKNA